MPGKYFPIPAWPGLFYFGRGGTARQRRRWILWEGPDGTTTMPRYFFHVEDGATFLDADGIDLPDLKAARDEAIRATGEMLREIPNAIHEVISEASLEFRVRVEQ